MLCRWCILMASPSHSFQYWGRLWRQSPCQVTNPHSFAHGISDPNMLL